MKKRLLVIVFLLLLVVAASVSLSKSTAFASNPVIDNYDPFKNLILDPSSINPFSAHTLQLKSFGFFTPTPEPRPASPELVECGPSGDGSNPYDLPNDENDILVAYSPAPPSVAGPGSRLILWYRDEHAMALGVSRVEVPDPITPRMTFPIVPYPGGLFGTIDSAIGTPMLIGAPYHFTNSSNVRDSRFDSVDIGGRPIFPAIFITDITTDPNNKSGDWENGGNPIPPHSVYGQWKVLFKKVASDGSYGYDQDDTLSSGAGDPPGNYDKNTNTAQLGPGSDPIPGITVQGHGDHLGEAAWEVDRLVAESHMLPNHTYRVQFIAHDGDQSQNGGDTAEACGTVRL